MEFKVHGIKTQIIKEGDNLVRVLLKSLKREGIILQDEDIIVVTSKIVSVSEGQIVSLDQIDTLHPEVHEISKITKLSPKFVELVLREAEEVYGYVRGAVLTLRKNVIQANAGVDSSNVGVDKAILLPKDSQRSADALREEIFRNTTKKVGIIIADSKVHPLRVGTSGFALAVSGFEPIVDDRGKKDLFGYTMRITRRALADNLVCAAEILMGESNEQTPMVLIRGVPIVMTDSPKSETMIISPEECMYLGGMRTFQEGKERV